MTVYIYDKNSLQVIAMPEVRFLDKFKENPNLFYPLYDSNTMTYSLNELFNPIIDNNSIREMTEYELVKSGKITLNEGSYLDEENKSVVNVPRPNDYSIWNTETNTWVVDNNLLNNKKKEIKTKLLQELTIAKDKFLNQHIEIEKNGKKYLFSNNNVDRDNLFTKLMLMNILGQNKLEKVKVINSNENVEFITLELPEIKTLMGTIQDIIEIADVYEQTAITGINRYSIEQLETLNVNEFFVI
jgi:hypothetical protein